MKKGLLLLIFWLFLFTHTARTDRVMELLNKMDLEELVEKLLEYDADGDGQLSELEVELQQPGIQKYLDRYAELLKAEEEEEEQDEDTDNENSKTKTAQGLDEQNRQAARNRQQQGGSTHTQTQGQQKNIDPQQNAPGDAPAVEDEDDGVEIEVIEDLEFVEEDDSSNYDHLIPAAVVCMTVGALTTLYLFCTRAKAGQQEKQLQKEERMMLQKEAWLNRVSNSQPKKDPANNEITPQNFSESLARKNKNTSASPNSQSQPTNSTTSPKPDSIRDDSGPKPETNGTPGDRSNSNSGSIDDDEGTPSPPEVATSSGPSVSQTSTNGAAAGESQVNAASHGQQTSSAASNEQQTSSAVSHGQQTSSAASHGQQTSSAASGESGARNGQDTTSSDASGASQDVVSSPQPPKKPRLAASKAAASPVPTEKTADIEKLKSLMEKTFSCELTLTDDIVRMRFSSGKMRIPSGHFPTGLHDVEAKMKVLVHQAFDKQVNKVKCAVKAYNLCESCGAAYHDKLVDSTVEVIKREAIVAVISHFLEESENSKQSDAGLWDTPDGGYEPNLYQYETYNFLPRLINNASDDVNISPSMLSELLTDPKADRMVSALLRVAGARFLACKRMDEVMMSEIESMDALNMLMNNAKFIDCFSKILTTEVDQAVLRGLGNYFQDHSAVSQLLKLSTIPSMGSKRHQYQPSQSALEPFRSLRSFPRLSTDDTNTAQLMIMKGVRQLQQLVYGALRRVLGNKEWREAGLAWLATLLNLNHLRTSSVLQDNNEVQPVCSDGFMVNLCGVMLEFFLPISQSSQKLEKVDLGYSASRACRMVYDFEACLAGGQIAEVKGQERKLGMLSTELQGQHSFITECFHLTQRALSITIIPAIKHFHKMNSHFMSQMEQVKGVDKAKEEQVHNQHVLVAVTWETCLMDNDLVYNTTMFYISQARLLLNIVSELAEKHKNMEEAEKAQKKALSVVPEFCIKDMAQWFSFLAHTVLLIKPNATKGISLTPFVDCCVMLLERPDLMPGPVPASMIVTALLTFMKENKRAGGVDRGWGSGVMSDLAAMVHTCPSAQTKLGPALLRTYVSVDTVEGLDVDKDSFDKFNTRVQIGQLVQKLWSRSDCRASIINQCGTELFQNFLDSILDTLLYMLHDSLSRIANVKKIETLKANEAEWNALSRRQQMEKDLFLRSEEKVGSGFMRQAKKTLKFLNLISQSEKVAHCFTRQPLATRAASTINGFLDSLCGAKAKNFKVKDMAKYEFNPVELLMDIVSVMLRITLEDQSLTEGYLVSMVKDPDFELANLEKAQAVIVDKGCTSQDTLEKLGQLMKQVRKLAAEHCPVMPSGDDDNNWRDAFVDLEIDADDLDKQYIESMKDLRFSCSRIQHSHCFLGKMQGDFDPRAPKAKTLMKEMKQLTTSLPVNAGASIFVRQDKDRMDVMRALVTGPTGTPYSLGCFCFDVYFPSAYPNVPPLVKIITTGSGTVRFNPNLYADGKVCLSLLGTWHAGDASEKWNPAKSSLYQVLVSIQSMILTPDPIFNEPGYERIKGTEEGEVQSRQYNWKLHLHTLRHAVLGQIRNPPPGFEHVIKRHFALQREAVLKQCAEWVKGCEDPDILRRLRQAADAIFEELMSLEVDFNEEEKDSDDEEDEEEDGEEEE